LRQPGTDIHEKLALDFHNALIGGENLRSYSLSSVEVKRSALTSVCFRS